MKKILLLLALTGGLCSLEATLEEEVPDVVKSHIQKAEELAVQRKDMLNKLVELSGLWRQSLEFERVALDDKMANKEKEWKHAMDNEKSEWSRKRNQVQAIWKTAIGKARNHLLREDISNCKNCITRLKELLNNQKAKVKMVSKRVRMSDGKTVSLKVPVLSD